MLTLHMWEPDGGGLSRAWAPWDDAMRIHSAFFLFGRFGAGWMPFGRLSEKAKAEANLAVQRVKERFGIDVNVVYSAPASVECER